jgi:hypothetical protein
VPQATIAKAASMTFTPGLPLFFGMLNIRTNGFIDLKIFLRFYRFASMYLEFDPNATQMVSYTVISKLKKPITL